MSHCRSMSIMPSGLYRCTLPAEPRFHEHHYSFYRPFTEDDMHRIKPVYGWAQCAECAVIKLIDGPYAERPPHWSYRQVDVTMHPLQPEKKTVLVCENCR